MFLLVVARFVVFVATKVVNLWNIVRNPRVFLIGTGIRPHHRDLISVGGLAFDPAMTHVPIGCIYTEEWYDSHGNHRIKLLQSGEEIPSQWETTPFDKEPARPWIWVGNAETETDLTRTFDKYLIVGNRITQQLVEHILPGRKLAYVDKTFKQMDFPGDGIVIEENV
jgi:hypothetical protein